MAPTRPPGAVISRHSTQVLFKARWVHVRKPPALRREQTYIQPMTQYALFDTAIGWAGLAWGDQGIVGVNLPERDPETARRGFQRRFPAAAEAEPPATLA